MDAIVYDTPSPSPSPSRGEGKGGGDVMKISAFILAGLREFGKHA
jgi:hypothetical protein